MRLRLFIPACERDETKEIFRGKIFYNFSFPPASEMKHETSMEVNQAKLFIPACERDETETGSQSDATTAFHSRLRAR